MGGVSTTVLEEDDMLTYDVFCDRKSATSPGSPSVLLRTRRTGLGTTSPSFRLYATGFRVGHRSNLARITFRANVHFEIIGVYGARKKKACKTRQERLVIVVI